MLNILLLIVISVASVRSALALLRSKALFVEFQCPQTVAYLAFLFPLGPVAQLVLSRSLGLLPASAIAVAVFIPGLLAFKRARYIFDRTGTDRTKVVQDSLAVVFITGVGGVVYVLGSTVIALALSYVGPA